MKPSTKVAALTALGLLTTVSGAAAVHAATSTVAPSPQVMTQATTPTATQVGAQEVNEGAEVSDNTSGKPDTDTETNETAEAGETGTETPDSPATK